MIKTARHSSVIFFVIIFPSAPFQPCDGVFLSIDNLQNISDYYTYGELFPIKN